MNFEIKNWMTGAVIFTAEIECSEDATLSIKLGLAVKKAVEAKVSLSYADLSSANLSSANLSSANLSSANLSSADLSYADLSYADLSYADLSYADLSYAASLLVSAGNNKNIKTIQAGDYIVNYTDTIMQIGCQKHTISDWLSFDDAKIANMNGKTALKFCHSWKPILQSIIAASPAEPTGYVEPGEVEEHETKTASE